MTTDPDDPPASFALPPLPPTLDAWFELVSDRGDDTEVIFDGAILDDLGVVDPASARLALVGYRWTFEQGVWIDQAERGSWDANWIVLDSIGADPLIADVSVPEVPVYEGRHGEGLWAPQRVADSLAEFVAELEVNEDVPGPPPFDEPVPDWSVWAIDLGPSPLRTLVSLADYPLFPSYSRAELLELRKALPVQLTHGLDESGAMACVEFGARSGAVFEARTYERTASAAPLDIDVTELFAEPPPVDEYTEPAPSDQLIASIEEQLGVRLPDALIALARQRNGGRLALTAYPMSTPTGWADDYVAATGLFAIGRTSRYSLVGDLGATFFRDEWGYPAWGVGFADTPSAGHELLMLDYRDSGPQGEPRVVHVDQERGYLVTDVAPDVATFLYGLVDEDEFDSTDRDAERAHDLERTATGSLSPIVRRALDVSPDLAFVEPAIRELGRRLVVRYDFLTVRGDPDSRLLLDTMFLLHSRVSSALGVDDFLAPAGETSYDRPSLPLMLFSSIADEPYTFRTGGYAPDFVREWWRDAVENGRLQDTFAGWRFETDAEAELRRTLEAIADEQ